MRRVVAALTLALAELVAATNVIQEWGGVHQPPEFEVVTVGGEDVAVKIHSNAHPNDPWLFQAFDSVTHKPGYINYIKIETTTSVGNIHLSVIPDPNHFPPLLHGADALKSVDLVTHGSPTYPNVIDEILISGDLGQDESIKAYGAGTLTIGDAIDQQGTRELRAYWRAVYEALAE